jgi:peptidoglycan/LPS O-acetylase OafA/YrhL
MAGSSAGKSVAKSVRAAFDEHGTFRPRTHVPGLDSLRGITILWTLFYHFNYIHGGVNVLEKGYIAWALMGVAAIDVFFVISGFLITGILLDSKESPTFYRTFYSRRALRIFPLYYAFLIAWFIVMPAVLGDPNVGRPFGIEAWYWLYGQNILISTVAPHVLPPRTYHLWSLALEEQFYLTWPLAVGLLNRANLKKLCIGLIIIAPIYRTVLWLAGVNYEIGFFILPGRADTLAVGCLLAIIAREPGGFQRARRFAKPGMIVGMAVIVATMIVTGGFYPQVPFIRTVGMTFSALAAVSVTILTVALPPTSLLSRMINLKALLYVGAISYGVYVFHWPVEFLANRWGFTIDSVSGQFANRMAGQAAYSLTLVAITLVLSAASWHLFEKPILGLRKYLPYETSKKKEEPIPPAP